MFSSTFWGTWVKPMSPTPSPSFQVGLPPPHRTAPRQSCGPSSGAICKVAWLSIYLLVLTHAHCLNRMLWLLVIIVDKNQITSYQQHRCTASCTPPCPPTLWSPGLKRLSDPANQTLESTNDRVSTQIDADNPEEWNTWYYRMLRDDERTGHSPWPILLFLATATASCGTVETGSLAKQTKQHSHSSNSKHLSPSTPLSILFTVHDPSSACPCS